MTTLLITHKIDEAEKICDKIGIMADGKFLTNLDTPQGLKQKYGITYMLRVDVIIKNDDIENSKKRVKEIIK